MHVHAQCPDGEAKFWLEPTIALAHNYGLSEPTGPGSASASRGTCR
jgi:hypothetical protein